MARERAAQQHAGVQGRVGLQGRRPDGPSRIASRSHLVKSKAEIRAAWLAQLHSTSPADRPGAEDAIARFYTAAKFRPPREIVWFDSPFDASLAVGLLAAPYNHIWRDRLSSNALSKSDRDRIDDAQASLA